MTEPEECESSAFLYLCDIMGLYSKKIVKTGSVFGCLKGRKENTEIKWTTLTQFVKIIALRDIINS
jgi:hypothetical protein